LVESDPGKSGIQELVAGLAAGVGIDPMKLLFEWKKKPLILPEHELDLKGHFLELRIYLGKRSESISFSEELVQSAAENSYAFVSAYTDYMIAALRKLKRQERKPPS
jgi:hypothetical protein